MSKYVINNHLLETHPECIYIDNLLASGNDTRKNLDLEFWKGFLEKEKDFNPKCLFPDSVRSKEIKSFFELYGIEEDSNKRVYFKMYQDKKNIDSSFAIIHLNEIESQLYSFKHYNEPPPIFEPTLLTKSEFQNLPDFEGF